jgi:hypothetical protein
MKKSLSVFMLLMAFGPSLDAKTNTAPSVAYADVLTAYNACVNGDVLAIPAGSASWNNTSITVAKAISIVGAGTNLTFISQPSQNTFWLVNPVSGKLVSIGNMSLTSPGNSVGSYPINVQNGSGIGWIRLHHINFTNGYSAINVTFNGGRCFGVIDHCLFYNPDICIQLNGNTHIWDDPILAGTTNTMVIEDCTFIQDAGANTADNQEPIMSGHGVKEVVRHCRWDMTGYPSTVACYPMEWHGQGNAYTGTDNDLRGPPLMEIYNNTFNLGARTGGRVFNNRGGSTLCFSNTVTYTGSMAFMSMTEDFELRVPPEFTTWAGSDQVENSYYWSNTVNGTLTTGYTLYDSLLSPFIQQGRDYFLYAPNATSGRVYWTDHPGGHAAVYTNGPSAYYPYTPLVYPHPLVTAQDGVGQGQTLTPPTNLRVISGTN